MALVRFQELLGEEEPHAEEEEETLDRVKALAAKLKLQTRRPSYLEWEARLQSPSWRSLGETRGGAAAGGGSRAPAALKAACGLPTVDKALDWLRLQLREMQALDHQLARQLMALRGQIHRLKMEQACHRHKEMLDDVTSELEGCEEDSDLLCDIPPRAAFLLSTPLKHIGVTRMNINSRRFSLC